MASTENFDHHKWKYMYETAQEVQNGCTFVIEKNHYLGSKYIAHLAYDFNLEFIEIERCLIRLLKYLKKTPTIHKPSWCYNHGWSQMGHDSLAGLTEISMNRNRCVLKKIIRCQYALSNEDW